MIGNSHNFVVVVLFFVSSTPDVIFMQTSSWENGVLEFLDVDLTLEAGQTGTDIIDAALDTIDLTCIFEDDRLLLRRIAAVLAKKGENLETVLGVQGGIWQLTQAQLEETQTNKQKLKGYWDGIKQIFNINWKKVTLEDLDKPLYSAIAFKLYLQTLIEKPPRNVVKQAQFIIDFFDNLEAKDYTTVVQGLQNTDCDSATVDVVLVLDGSGSVGKDDFEKVLDFTVAYIDALDLGEDKTRVGVVQFSDRVRAEFFLDDYYDKAKAKREVAKIEYLEGSTNTADALRLTGSEMFTTDGGARTKDPGISKIAIVLTDGNSDDPVDTAIAATALQNDGVAVFAVGVGSNVDEAELSAIATDPDCSHSFRLTDFSEVVTFVDQIKRSACKEPAQYTLGDEIKGTLIPKQKKYLTFIADVENGIAMDISTIFGEVEVYLSTKTKNPGPASHQWKCRGNLEKRGTCKIPGDILKALARNRKEIELFARVGAPQDEFVRFIITFFSGGEHLRAGLTVILTALILNRILE